MPKDGPKSALRRRNTNAALIQPVRNAEGAYAALDLGTNNCRLLIARRSGTGFRVVDAFSRIVRLGEGLAATGRLQDSAMQRTIEALEHCAERIGRHHPVTARCIATEACRKSANSEEFIERVRKATGLKLEVISTREEADLAVLGCEPLMFDDTRHALVFDIGGGSTELIWQRRNGARPVVAGAMSLPLGVVNFAERYGGNRYDSDTYDRMADEVRARLLPFESRYGLASRIGAGAVQMIGTSGTVTTLASVSLGQARYNRREVDGSVMTFEEIAAVSRRLAGMSFSERAALGPIGRSRADLVVPGTAILKAICELWPVGRMCVADRGLREGMIVGLLSSEGKPSAPAASG